MEITIFKYSFGKVYRRIHGQFNGDSRARLKTRFSTVYSMIYLPKWTFWIQSSPKYIQWTILSLLYQTRRKDPLLQRKRETYDTQSHLCRRNNHTLYYISGLLVYISCPLHISFLHRHILMLWNKENIRIICRNINVPSKTVLPF